MLPQLPPLWSHVQPPHERVSWKLSYQVACGKFDGQLPELGFSEQSCAPDGAAGTHT
jgi:hypothetical protein